MKGKLIFILVAVALVVTAFFIFGKGVNGNATLENYNGEITIYKSITCGCCDVYSSYFKNKGNSNVKTIQPENIDEIKARYNIPEAMRSCHTTVIGEYFVEGHIPIEAIEKLLSEKPNIAGIALPGMPMGSPGMVGNKQDEFVVYAVNEDGSYDEFLRI